MVVQVTYRAWYLTNTPKKKVHQLKGVVSGFLKTWRFTFLGSSYGDEEVLLSIQIFLY
jgi:hypothetical protein